MSENKLDLQQKVEQLKISRIEKHIFLCGGPKCCNEELGEFLWTHLKDRLSELGFEHAPVFRTKVKCLRICQRGPIALVYPDGTWYGDLTIETLNQIIDEHLVANRVVEDLVIAKSGFSDGQQSNDFAST